MKTLKLAFSRIFTYFSENKMIFILYLIGTISCIFMMIYYYGNTLTYKTGINDDEVSFKLYEIEFLDPVDITAETLEKLKDFEESYGIQDIILYSVLDENGNDTIEPEYIIEYEEDGRRIVRSVTYDGSPGYRLSYPGATNSIILTSYINNNNNVFYNPKSNTFTSEQLHQNVLVAPKGKSEDLKIQGQDFEIIRNESVPYYVIPIEKYFDSKIRTTKMQICISERFSKNMVFRYGDFLKNLFKGLYPDNTGIKFYLPDAFYGQEDFAVQQEFALIIAIFMVSIISFMFLLKYLIDSNRRENSILMMVGAKRKHIVAMNFIENLVLMLISTFIAIALHALLYNDVISKANLYENITYSVQDYAIIAIISIGISIIVQIPFMIAYWFKNIRKLKEESR